MNSTPRGSSVGEPSTSPHEKFSEEAEGESTTTSSAAWIRAFQTINLDSLTPRSQSINLLIGERMTEGYRPNEIAEKLGRPQSWVAERLDELRSEITLDSGGFLPLNPNEFDSLKESIKEFGVRSPVLIGEHQLIDGRHRWLISQELGLEEIPAQFIFGLTADQEHDIAVAVNSARRHLNRHQKKMIIRGELKRNWSRSSRQIGAICGVSSHTVEAVRAAMREEAAAAEQRAEEPEFKPPSKEEDVRVDSRSARPRKAYVPDRHAPILSERFLGYAVCSHGQMHSLWQVGEEFVLKEDRD